MKLILNVLAHAAVSLHLMEARLAMLLLRDNSAQELLLPRSITVTMMMMNTGARETISSELCLPTRCHRIEVKMVANFMEAMTNAMASLALTMVTAIVAAVATSCLSP